MDFMTAWEKLEESGEIRTAKEERLPATVWIRFAVGSASMRTPKFYKDVTGTRDTVKHAWETYCRGDERLLNSVTDVRICTGSESFEDNIRKSREIA